jgi:hypothetical protein
LQAHDAHLPIRRHIAIVSREAIVVVNIIVPIRKRVKIIIIIIILFQEVNGV